jgi:hypothetical protein
MKHFDIPFRQQNIPVDELGIPFADRDIFYP